MLVHENFMARAIELAKKGIGSVSPNPLVGCILVKDGEIIAAAQEERFTRKKHDNSFPKKAIQYCLKEAGIEGSDLDYVAFYDKPFLKFERILETYLAFAPMGIKSFLTAMPLWIKKKMWIKKLIY